MRVAATDSPLALWLDTQRDTIVSVLRFFRGFAFSDTICIAPVMEGWEESPNCLGYYFQPHHRRYAGILINCEALELTEDREPNGAAPRWQNMSNQALYVFGVMLHELIHDADRHNKGHVHGISYAGLCERAARTFGFQEPAHPYEWRKHQGHPRTWPLPFLSSTIGGFAPRHAPKPATSRTRIASPRIAACSRPTEPTCSARTAAAIAPAMMATAAAIAGVES